MTVFVSFLCIIPSLFWGTINFLHIPKTGGSSIHYLLLQHFDNTLFYPHQRIERRFDCNFTSNFYNAVMRRFPVIENEIASGHFPMWFLNVKNLKLDSSFLFTSLREPVDRVISQYFFVQNYYDSPIEVTANIQCKMLSSDITLTGEDLLQDAIKTLHRMDFIVFMDDFEPGVRRLFKKLGVEKTIEQVPCVRKSKRSPLPEEVLQSVRALNDLDVRLYEYATTFLRYKSY